jgi:very-short-patch-repair endonuclease
MDPETVQPSSADLWALVHRQHGVVTTAQLLELRYDEDEIRHRVANGRLHPISRGVYAVGRPRLSTRGRLLAAVLACGPEAALSHETAAGILRIRPLKMDSIEVSVPARVNPRREGIRVHRRAVFGPEDVVVLNGMPLTNIVCTLTDVAARLERTGLEGAVNEADKLGLIDPERLRSAIDDAPRRPGVAALRELLDRSTFSLTDSQLERRFVPLARKAGLAAPLTGRRLNGFKVDFFWPELGLVVETDGLRYHRTPAQQARDRVRDQAHTAAGLTVLRFTHAQVAHETGHVEAVLGAVAERLR